MLTRRKFLAQSALASLAARNCLASSPTADVSTPLGMLRGEQLPGCRVFRGVPFAQPPVGTLRFRPPQPMRPWVGTREALKFAPPAIQPGGDQATHSEDCLYLNVWAPDTPGPHPVFVWIHGGGFTGGKSSDPMSDGSGFAREGVVCITVAYRLGVFGFLDWSPTLGASYAGSANNGIRDLIAALTWVQQNVAAFGGDPKAVTLGGESAGAKLTDLLLGVPAAKNLFHQAISESGGADRIWSRAQALEVGAGWRSTWTSETSSPATAALTAEPAQLVRLQETFQRDWPTHFPFRPEIDGELIKQSPLVSIREGLSRSRRLLIGTNLDESAFFLGPSPAKDPSSRDLGNLPLDSFRKVELQYSQVYPELKPPMLRVRSVTAEEYWVPSVRVAEAHVGSGGEAFFYRMDFPAETGRFLGLAYHSYDLRFVWDHFADKPTEADRNLSNAMHASWCAFIQGKTPAAPGLPPWPTYTLQDKQTMILNTTSTVQRQPHAEELKLWDGLL